MIRKIEYNWVQTSDGEISGPDYEIYEVGKNGVTHIVEHRSEWEGDKWFYDIIFEDENRKETVFNVNKVYRIGDNE